MHASTTSYAWKASLLTVAALVSACSLILEAEDTQCSTSADCDGHGLAGAACVNGSCVMPSGSGGSGGDAGTQDAEQDGSPDAVTDADLKWGCVGNVSWPDPDISKPVQLRRQILKLISEAPVEGLTLTACTPLDVECLQPVGSGITNENGEAEIPVYSGFEGYLQAAPPASYPDMIPSIDFAFPPPVEDDPVGVGEPLHFTAQGEAEIMVGILKTEIDPTQGHIFALAVDCLGLPTAGASLKLDTIGPNTIPYYMNGSLPSTTMAETGTEGEAGFLNVPPGSVTITTTVSGVGKVSQLTVLVKPGHITYLPLTPSP